MRSSSAIRLAAFDMGGVMIEVDESIPVARFAELSGRPTDEVFAEIFSPEKKRPIETGEITRAEHARRATAALGLDLDEREFWRIHCTSHRPDIAVGEIITAVSAQTHVTIASTLPSPHWDWAQANLPYAHMFDKPVLSFKIGVMKPDSGYYEHLVRHSGVQPDEIFFTDDRPENVEAAASLGIRAFHFDGTEKLLADLNSCGVKP
ncbi:MAG: HAD family phosphatase [Chloroflexi bacterium]|nr:HAD family phosphatase [Chloroflexota bacterium]